ncbi:LOW QUALITY PROTEIN: olfactory receptor 2H2 [Glossophaga mutica]
MALPQLCVLAPVTGISWSVSLLLRSGQEQATVSQRSPGSVLLLAFSAYPGSERILFMVVFISYLLNTLVGNALIILPSMLNPSFYSPMYVLLSSLFFLDICFTTNCVPMLVIPQGPKKTIIFFGYSVQLFSFLFLEQECILLTGMPFNLCAVCQPLHATIIHPHLCWLSLAAVAWVTRLLESVVQASLTLHLPFYPHQQMDGFVGEVLTG